MKDLEDCKLERIRSKDTPGYWKKLTKEAGLELEDIEWLAKDRLKWWAEMMGRQERIEQWGKGELQKARRRRRIAND